MQRERISSNVPRQTKLRVQKSAKALGISESKFIEQAIETDLDKLDIRKALKRRKENNEKLVHERDTTRVARDKAEASAEEARRQRDHFKAKFDDTLTDYNAAIAKIKALYSRGLLARIFNRPPKI